MGIITGPGYDLYGMQNPCCLPGKTPKKLFAIFADIKIADTWVPAFGGSCNGWQELEQTEPFIWKNLPTNRHTIIFNMNMYVSGLLATSDRGLTCFLGKPTTPCNLWFENDDKGALQFHGGKCTIIMREDSGDYLNSIKNTCKLLQIEPGKKTFCEPMIDEEGKVIMRICKQLDGTRLHIKLK